jgi:hypothetical protein
MPDATLTDFKVPRSFLLLDRGLLPCSIGQSLAIAKVQTGQRSKLKAARGKGDYDNEKSI